MAKQTFTTGQVLTAAQMTSLQQTAMGGGSTTAKTASYVLVAADAGTVVQMNSASATTITVNTALFAAGDTVQIQNVGAGVCTVTAGTATVSTSAVLALKQYDAGSLYFNSTSAALFFAADAADNTSPLTTKGDLYGFSTLNARIPIGTNNQVLTADSAEALGLKWATASSGLTFIASASPSAASSQSFNSCFSATYQNYLIVMNMLNSTTEDPLLFRMRASSTDASGSDYDRIQSLAYSGGTLVEAVNNATSGRIGVVAASVQSALIVNINRPFDAVPTMLLTNESWYNGNDAMRMVNLGNVHNVSTSFDGITIFPAAGTMTGTIRIYGYQNS